MFAPGTGVGRLPGDSITTLVDAGEVTLASPDSCDHNGRASGRLVLEEDGFRCELVCECGCVMTFLGREEYQLNARPARQIWGSASST